MPKIQLDAVYYVSTQPIDALTLGRSENGVIGRHPDFYYHRHDEHKDSKTGLYVGRFLIEDASVRTALSKVAGVTVIYPLHRPLKANALTALAPICGAAAGDVGEDAVLKLQSAFTLNGTPIQWLDPWDRYHHF